MEASLKILAFIPKTRKECSWQVFLCRQGTCLELCFTYITSGSRVEGHWMEQRLKVEGQGNSPERSDVT